MFYATLRDMIMYLHKDEHGLKKGGVYASMSNAIRVHHALATKASDYKKKQHVLRVQTADWAQYLFQTRFVIYISMYDPPRPDHNIYLCMIHNETRVTTVTWVLL